MRNEPKGESPDAIKSVMYFAYWMGVTEMFQTCSKYSSVTIDKNFPLRVKVRLEPFSHEYSLCFWRGAMS